MNLTQQLITNSAKNLNKAAYQYLGKEVLYKDFLVTVAKLSYLFQRELGHKVRMAYLCRNSPAMLTTFLAMTNIRAVSIMIPPDLPPGAIADWIKESQPTHLAVTSDLLSKAREILAAYKLSLPIVEIEKKHGGEYASSFSPPPDQAIKETDPVLLLRSAGTNAKPKFGIFTHKQLVSGSTAFKGLYHLNATDHFLTPLPWAHPFPLIHGMLFPLLCGATLVIDHGMQGKEFLEFLTQSKTTRLIATAPLLHKLNKFCLTTGRAFPPLKSITLGLGLLSKTAEQDFFERKIPVLHCYGQMEGLWTLAMEDLTETAELSTPPPRGAMGKALPGFRYKVMDSDMNEVEGKDSRTGQLAVMTPTVMQGYFGKENEKENKMVIRGTWLYTGDLFRLEGEGDTLTLTFLGRKDELSDGLADMTDFETLDEAMKSNPGIADAASFSIKKGSVLTNLCIVVRHPEVPITEREVLQHALANCTPVTAPRAIAFIDQIPKDLGGNINYTRLRKQFEHLAG